MTRFMSSGFGQEIYEGGSRLPGYGYSFVAFSDLAVSIVSSDEFPLVPYTSQFPIGSYTFFSNVFDQPAYNMFRVEQIEIFYALGTATVPPPGSKPIVTPIPTPVRTFYY